MLRSQYLSILFTLCTRAARRSKLFCMEDQVPFLGLFSFPPHSGKCLAVRFDILTALPIFPTANIANQMELMVGPPCRVDRAQNNFSSRIFWCKTIQHFSVKSRDVTMFLQNYAFFEVGLIAGIPLLSEVSCR